MHATIPATKGTKVEIFSQNLSWGSRRWFRWFFSPLRWNSLKLPLSSTINYPIECHSGKSSGLNYYPKSTKLLFNALNQPPTCLVQWTRWRPGAWGWPHDLNVATTTLGDDMKEVTLFDSHQVNQKKISPHTLPISILKKHLSSKMSFISTVL